MDAWLPILLFVIGLGLVVAEVFFPSAGLLTILALASFGTGLFLAFQVGASFGWGALVALVLVLPAVIYGALKVFPKTSIGRSFILSGPSYSSSEARGTQDSLEALAGRTGRATSRLRPSGTAEIDGRRVDVITRGEMIERGEPIRVVEVSGNRVVVVGIVVPAETDPLVD